MLFGIKDIGKRERFGIGAQESLTCQKQKEEKSQESPPRKRMVTGRRFFSLAVLLAFTSLNAQSYLNILSPLHETHYLEGGSEIKGTITMGNTGDEVLKMRAYQKDFCFNHRGETLFTEPGTLERSNAGWIYLPFTYFEIPPFTSFSVYYTLHVPKDSCPQGSYWSVIMLESTEDIFATSPDGTVIQAIKRIAFQAIAEVGDQGTYKLNLMDKRVEVSPEIKCLVFDVENTGTLTMKLHPSIELLDGEGKTVGSFSCEKQMMHPGCSSKFCVDLSSVAFGHYLAKVLFKHNDESILGSQYQIEIPDFLPKISKRGQQ
jgi:hypothetical protein